MASHETPPVSGALAAWVRRLDAVSMWSARIFAWLILPMVLSLVWEVVARYIFNAPTIWAYDMTYMLYGAFFMLGSAYTLMRGGHIRTDTFYASWPPQRQGLVDAICYVLFFFPGLIAFLWVTSDFFWASLLRSERVVSSPWMPVIYPLKFVMPVTCVLLILQGVAELLRAIHAARTGIWLPRPSLTPNNKEQPSV
jgi:TRAP-type mannitol/chloroaromatic compound transport system permease small subunit